MRFPIPPSVQADILKAIGTAISDTGMVNVPFVAERVRSRNLHENIALEDVERAVLSTAQMFRAAIEFDSSAANLEMMPEIGAIVTVKQI